MAKFKNETNTVRQINPEEEKHHAESDEEEKLKDKLYFNHLCGTIQNTIADLDLIMEGWEDTSERKHIAETIDNYAKVQAEVQDRYKLEKSKKEREKIKKEIMDLSTSVEVIMSSIKFGKQQTQTK